MLILQIVLVIGLSGVSNAGNDPLAIVKPFTVCHGENTGAGTTGLATQAVVHYATCGALINTDSSSKYCSIRCVAEKIGAIDPTTKMMDGNAFSDTILGTKKHPRRARLVEKVKACAKGKKFDEFKDCKSMKEVIYCVKNNFEEVCNDYKGPPKFDPTKASSESDSGVISTVGNLELRKSLD